jgi:hypothetical protein
MTMKGPRIVVFIVNVLVAFSIVDIIWKWCIEAFEALIPSLNAMALTRQGR